MGRYVALLRGINVGGRNLIRMEALVACFEAHGFRDVVTLIQSGNVLFSAPPSSGLGRQVEAMLEATFRYPASVVLRSRPQLRAVVEKAPPDFGSQAARYRYNVIFLREPLKAAAALRQVSTREGVDQAHAGPGVLYFRHLIAQASKSRLSKIITLPIYKQMTIRNWNTTSKLLRMMEPGQPPEVVSARRPARPIPL
jgi:uncharacterized protein (DUF1697 family)